MPAGAPPSVAKQNEKRVNSRADDREADPLEVQIVTRHEPSPSGSAHRAMRERPRLSVIHLLLWITCCALYLAIARLMTARAPGTLGMFFLAMLAAGNGAAWAGLLITLARSFRRSPWPIEPGQWLLALLGAVAIVEALAESATGKWLKDPRGVVQAATACAFVVPLFSKRLAARWKWLFASVSFLFALPLLVALSNAHGLGRTMAHLTPARVTLAAAVGSALLASYDRLSSPAKADTRAGKSGWLHWTGIVTAACLAMLRVAGPWLLAG